MVSRVMLGTDMLENTSVRCIFDHFYDGTKGHAGHGNTVKHNVFGSFYIMVSRVMLGMEML